MDNRAIRAAADKRNAHLLGATLAGIGLVCMRVLGALIAILSDDVSRSVAAIALVEAGLCACLVYKARERRLWAAIALVLIWLGGFLYGWIASGNVFPPFAVISLSIGVGLVVGVYALMETPVSETGESDEPVL